MRKSTYIFTEALAVNNNSFLANPLMLLAIAGVMGVLAAFLGRVISLHLPMVLKNGWYGLLQKNHSQEQPLLHRYKWVTYTICILLCLVVSQLVILPAESTEYTPYHRVLVLFMVSMMLAMSIVDCNHFILPDIINKPLLWLGLLLAALGWGWLSPKEAILGAVMGWFVLSLSRRMIMLMKGRVLLGLGDVKLMAAYGAWVGVMHSLEATSLGCMLAIIMQIFHRKRKIPFGPFLVLASIVMLISPWHII
ncbi:MAG: prepilin peptidase [Alphaproteobacteria bacterium]